MDLLNPGLRSWLLVFAPLRRRSLLRFPSKTWRGGDILPLQENFNAHTEQMRILLLLSPGCGRCLDTSGKVESASGKSTTNGFGCWWSGSLS